jgi:hypothetical protein
MTSIHDPLFGVPVQPMYRWGASPFRMRGVVYRDTLSMADRLLERRGLRVADVLRQHGDAAFEKFMSQRFSPTDWYDIYPSIHLAPVLAKARGVTLSQHMRDAALAHAEWAFGGFSAVILKLVSNETVATWIPRISAWYHDFGGVEAKAAGERHVRGARTGMPGFAVQGWSIVSMQFVEHMLTRAGARDVRAHALDAEPDGSRHGCVTYRVAFELRWAE